MKRTTLNPFEKKVYEAAVAYTAFQFGGRGNRNRVEAETEAQAIAAATAMKAANPRNQRPVMVYAVDGFGNSAMIGTI